MATQSVKDILNTEIPSPSFVLSPSVPAPLPSGVTHTRNGGDDVARTLDPYSGKFEHVNENTPRVYGGDQSLLVEAARTNHIKNSSDATQWGTPTSTSFPSAQTSVIAGETAYEVKSDSSSDDRLIPDAGQTTSSQEVLTVIVEKGTSDRTRLRPYGDSGGFGNVIFDFIDEEIDTLGGADRADARLLDGRRNIYEIRIAYTPSSSGQNQRAILYPDPDGGLGSTIFHHAQIEETPNASSPIVTQGSAATRAGDDYTIFDYRNDPERDYPEWYNDVQSTWFVDITPRYYNNSTTPAILTANGTSGIILYAGTTPDGLNWGSLDGTNVANPAVGNPAFQSTKIAVSLTQNEIRCSVLGKSEVTSHNGSLLNRSSIDLGGDILLASINRLLYFPRALPESTLNTLTS